MFFSSSLRQGVSLVSPISPLTFSRSFSFSSPNLARRYAKTKPVSPKTELIRKLRVVPKSGAPKRPLSAYTLYMKDSFKSAHTRGTPATQTMANLANSWKSADSATKQKYEVEAQRLKAAYEKEYAKFLNNVKPDQALASVKRRNLLKKLNPSKSFSKPLVDPNAPKKPLSSYILFVKDARAAAPDVQTQILGKSFAEMSITESAKALGSAWNRMPKDRKELYQNQAVAASAKYREAVKAYNARNGVTKIASEMTKRISVAALGRRVLLKGRRKAVKRVVKRKVRKSKKVLKKPVRKTKKTAAKKTAKTAKKTTKKTIKKKPAKKVVKKTARK
ncbi:exp1-like protein [Nowakowskiella sp. JEL0407]|nr:exp1-like protein [Nowakowskiella sp. JEL0407]